MACDREGRALSAVSEALGLKGHNQRRVGRVDEKCYDPMTLLAMTILCTSEVPS